MYEYCRNLTRFIFHLSIDAEKKPLRYMAGMLRTCQLEKMMTKEELEEEQRAQREQLAAIFQLLKDKQDTFEVKRAVDLIPKPSIFLPVPENSKDGCIRCAVVGTGGILNNSKMGKEIDSHDYVFRVNGAVIQGYEEDVGNKTSVYVHTSFSMYSNIITLKKYGFNSIPLDKGIKYVMIPEGMRDFDWLQGLLQGKASNGSFKGVSIT
ncbi:alpha-N-acetylgalactosaminide alpha-2,6-sialyltransferase 1-like protein [Labeo rohita]|uniref:alpha-N-acetylgalactosaminide alpha-2,6-sialyltransferase n=1 Tax=Labeo rohita TaxID=84645 RepID=A0A498M0K6_LABRO|nr:alpha-N-acetylgalactosaminide alpha-2,6-sialyltransferase 1-like protein [Labeo rohita]RXN11185.1 alpha-N-acetylgalactosaminide alpha-2,6-sialyltransferase 1-like protein [Labeo rohita]